MNTSDGRRTKIVVPAKGFPVPAAGRAIHATEAEIPDGTRMPELGSDYGRDSEVRNDRRRRAGGPNLGCGPI